MLANENAPTKERAADFMEYAERNNFVHFIKHCERRFGKDAVIFALMEMFEMNDRGLNERVGELAFNLTPGAVRRIYAKGNLMVHHLPRDMNENISITRIDLKRFVVDARVGFDEYSGTLVCGSDE